MAAFRCSNCAAPLESEWVSGTVVTCGYCRVSQPSPFDAKKRSVLRLDCSNRTPIGFQNRRGAPATGPDGSPELVVSAGAHQGYEYALATEATYEDFELRVRLRLLFGDTTTTKVNVVARNSERGYVAFVLGSQGAIRVFRGIGRGAPETIQDWTRVPGLRTEVGAPNDLVIEAEGPRMSLAVNGAHAAVTRAPHARDGKILVGSLSKVPHAYAIAALEIISSS